MAYLYARYQIAWFDEGGLFMAALTVVPFAIVSLLFTLARFSFGYFVGFYFYTMVLGYLWLSAFSKFDYNHTLTSASAFASALAFFVPALFITSPIKQRFVLTARALDHLLSGILILATTIIAAGAFYSFRLVGLADIYLFRGELAFPVWLRYAIGATSGTLLPFAFACFVVRGNPSRAAAALLLLLLIYPITLTKLALFAPFWLLYLALLSRLFESRTTVILSLLLPVLFGVTLAFLIGYDKPGYEEMLRYFATINFRMIAFPAIALDLYNDFFSTHSHTYFCQISFLKLLVDCPYTEPLAIVMERTYLFGNLNASPFATEGIASVGPILAPLTAFAFGLVIAVANCLSSGLSPRFVLMSGALLPNILLNVPLSITLLTYGAAILFLLWYVTPRTMFEASSSSAGKPC